MSQSYNQAVATTYPPITVSVALLVTGNVFHDWWSFSSSPRRIIVSLAGWRKHSTIREGKRREPRHLGKSLRMRHHGVIAADLTVFPEPVSDLNKSPRLPPPPQGTLGNEAPVFLWAPQNGRPLRPHRRSPFFAVTSNLPLHWPVRLSIGLKTSAANTHCGH